MHKKYLSFQDYQKRGRIIFLLFCFDAFFVLMAFIASLFPAEPFRSLTTVSLVFGLFSLILIFLFSRKNRKLIVQLQEYFFSNNYGATAIRIMQFHKLMDENLFEYHFQPIINARTGEIFAYEALMRTNSETIHMLPTEILELAAKEDRLYDIEMSTFSNSLKIMQQYSDVFSSKKLFINSISGHQLNDEDFEKLHNEYSSLFPNIVLEITEVTNLDDAGINIIHQRLKNTSCQLALDDYGTGYSNESILLNSNPNYVKIDRTILHNINIDIKKQLLVSNLVNFAVQNNIKVIAEGIETFEELEFVINLGVDFVQGYYTAKPERTLINSMPEALINKINDINSKRFLETTLKRVYVTKNDKVLSIAALALEMYSELIVYDSELTLQGKKGVVTNLCITIPDNQRCCLTLNNVIMKSFDTPAITLGKNCSLTLNIIGDNTISFNGIRVPETSDLTIIGDGNLSIETNHGDKVGIGGTHTQSYGDITFAFAGVVNVHTIGNMSVGIGGGQNTSNSRLHFTSGEVFVHSSGNQTVGIGCMSGYAGIMIEHCKLHVRTEATRAVCIGCFNGTVEITSSGELEMKCEGRNAAIIGALDGSDGKITINGGTVSIRNNTHNGAGIGSINAKVNIDIYDGDIIIYGEGTDVVGIGDLTGYGDITIHNGVLSVQIYAVNPLPIGNINKAVMIDGGNIQCDFPAGIMPKNSYGTPLLPRLITDTDEFRQTVETINYSYEYMARYTNRHPYIKVYLPETVAY